MDRTALSPLLRSFERHLRAANRSERTIASYLEGLRQAEAFLAARGKGLADARRTDLEAFLGDLLTRRAAGTVATRYKVLRILPSRSSTASTGSRPISIRPSARSVAIACRTVPRAAP